MGRAFRWGGTGVRGAGVGASGGDICASMKGWVLASGGVCLRRGYLRKDESPGSGAVGWCTAARFLGTRRVRER